MGGWSEKVKILSTWFLNDPLVKVSSDFGFNAFLPVLVDICWIYTEDHPGIFFLISLGSLVLFKDSKTMVRFFGGRNFELLQCSAERCRQGVIQPGGKFLGCVMD